MMEYRSKRLLRGALLGLWAASASGAAAETLSDADKIAKLEHETQLLQQQLKQLQSEITKTRKKAEKVEAAQAAAPTPSPTPVSLTVPGSAVVPVAAEPQSSDKTATTLGGLKDKAETTLSSAGLTFYGTIDMGYAYTSNGVPASGSFYVGGDYTIYGSRYANRGISTITNNALEQSKAGLLISEDIYAGWTAIGKIETGFNPLSGEFSDACASLLRNSGKIYQDMTVNGDGSRCGQFLNGAAYGGISNATYGTLTFGRQNSLVLDGMGTYDPMALSYAFSILGYTGTVGPGIGSTETARWDDSVKYVYTYGPVHVAGMFTSGGQETPMVGSGYAANAGGGWNGFSIDGFYTKENGAVNLTFIPNPADVTGAPAGGNGITSCVAGVNCPNALLGTITDNEAWDVMAKYTFDFGGGLKDETPSAKLTFFAGYQYVTLSNPSRPESAYNGFNTIGGYRYLTEGALAYGSDRILQTEWAGANYTTGPWSITAAYYNWNQNSYLNASFHSCEYVNAHLSTSPINNGVGKQVGGNCSGDYNQGSFLIDYIFNKHFDVYGGVSYTEIDGGLASGFLRDTDTTFATGIRVKW
jgi:predicted porin